jgi:predicted transcriptional regulator
MPPDQYRERWGLPYDYPMVAPSYAGHRSALANPSYAPETAGQRKVAAT